MGVLGLITLLRLSAASSYLSDENDSSGQSTPSVSLNVSPVARRRLQVGNE